MSVKEAEKYLRRNLIVSKAFGVQSGLEESIKRLPKRTPVWLRKILTNELKKMPEICNELAAHRDELKESVREINYG